MVLKNSTMNLEDELKMRRDFFTSNFPMIKIGRERIDVNSKEILRNTCPVCGYLTLDERDSFEICSICFWEDDGIDDCEANLMSGPNHMTLNEARHKFQTAKNIILNPENDNSIKSKISAYFLELDNLIVNNSKNKELVLKVQNELIELFLQNKIYGIENLIE